MPQILAFVYGRLCIQEVLIIHAIIHKGINSEVAYTERSQVLEEVGPGWDLRDNSSIRLPKMTRADDGTDM